VHEGASRLGTTQGGIARGRARAVYRSLHERGVGRVNLRTAAGHLLRFVRILPLRKLRDVSEEELERAARSWIDDRHRFSNHAPGHTSIFYFRWIVRKWLRFLGRLLPLPRRAQAFSEELADYKARMSSELGLAETTVTVSDLRRIYRARNIRIDLWPHKFKTLKAAYFSDELGMNVLAPKGVSGDGLVFLLAHALKHHLLDAGTPVTCCMSSDECSASERSADLFASELIYPGKQFERDLRQMGIRPGRGSEEALARLRIETRTTLSQAVLLKRAKLLWSTNQVR
jgi:hypothetical protein